MKTAAMNDALVPCLVCGSPLRGDASFCGNCGTPRPIGQALPPEVPATCATCGCPLRPGISFCGNCGTPRAATPPNAPVELPQTPPTSCGNCGLPLGIGALFCGNCGTPTAAERPAPDAHALPPGAPPLPPGGHGLLQDAPGSIASAPMPPPAPMAAWPPPPSGPLPAAAPRRHTGAWISGTLAFLLAAGATGWWVWSVKQRSGPTLAKSVPAAPAVVQSQPAKVQQPTPETPPPPQAEPALRAIATPTDQPTHPVTSAPREKPSAFHQPPVVPARSSEPPPEVPRSEPAGPVVTQPPVETKTARQQEAPSPMPQPTSAPPVTAPPRSMPAAVPPPTSNAHRESPTPPEYNGPLSGSLLYSGPPVVQNGEIVFEDLPPVPLRLSYDTRAWDGRLVPGDRGTQRLILRSKKPGTQKKCAVRWDVAR